MKRWSLFFFLLTAIAAPNQSIGQHFPENDLPVSGNMKPSTPVMNARPLGSSLEIQNLRTRPADDADSVGGFIQSLQGEDAMIQVIVGRGRLLTLQQPLSKVDDHNIPVVAVGDPTVLDIDIFPNPRVIRLLGKRVGTTDLSIVTADGKAYSFVIQVTYDVDLIRAYIKQLFPDADIRIAPMNEHLVVEGQARSTAQVDQIIQTLFAYLSSAQVARTIKSQNISRGQQPLLNPDNSDPGDGSNDPVALRGDVGDGLPGQEKPDITATLSPPQIINLIRVPGVQQVMLKVRIAELNRTAFREMGADWLYRDSSGRTFGSLISGAGTASATGENILSAAISSIAGLSSGQNTTGFAIIPNGNIELVLAALRENQILSVLAEPNLVAMHGQEASFLAGGEFPVPVPQGFSDAITIQYKQFGVQLHFVPYILDDETIRLHVAPEVSTIDNAIGVTTNNGTSVPGINTRRVKTAVELRQGQTLAVAGLLQVTMDGETARIPGLGDIPYLGSLFSNTTHQRVEKELLVLVTPYFVDAMEEHQVPQLPGADIQDPTDHELYGLGRIEGLDKCNYRATTGWNDPLRLSKRIQYEAQNVYGPYGFSR